MTREEIISEIEQVAYNAATDGCHQPTIEREAEALANRILSIFGKNTWECRVNIVMDNGQLAFTKGKVYRRIDHGSFNLLDNTGTPHGIPNEARHYFVSVSECDVCFKPTANHYDEHGMRYCDDCEELLPDKYLKNS